MTPQSPDNPSGDGRKAPRRRVLKSARIVFNNKNSTISCTVRDLTEAGALLVLPSTLGVPDEFDLVVGSAPPRHCRIVHRHADRLGVAFEEF